MVGITSQTRSMGYRIKFSTNGPVAKNKQCRINMGNGVKRKECVLLHNLRTILFEPALALMRWYYNQWNKHTRITQNFNIGRETEQTNDNM